jgi:hypothetical protein
VPEYPNTLPPEPSGPSYSARVALSCEQGHAPGQVLHALQELQSVIDDRLSAELGDRYDRHRARSAGTDKLTVTFTLRAATHADAIGRGDRPPERSRNCSPSMRQPSISRASRS